MSISSRIEQIEQHLKDDYDVLGLAGAKGTELPIGYTQVDYIENSGTQFIDTGVKTSTNHKVVGEIEFTQLGNSSIYGNYTSSPQFVFEISATNAWEYKDSNSWVTSSTSGGLNTKYMVEFNVTETEQYLKINDISVVSSTHTFSSATSNDNAYLFARNFGSVAQINSKIKLYNFKIYDNGVLIRDYVPCYRNSDNEVGMYDLVNDVFYTNQGTGVFTYGSVVLNRNIQNLKPQWLDRLVYFMNNGLDVVWENWEKVTGTGTSLTLNNTINAPMKVELKGNTSQEVIQGEIGLEVENTSIYVNDVNEDKENYITLKGNTYQETTTGKNLSNFGTGTTTPLGLTIIRNGSELEISGTTTGPGFILNNSPVITLPAGTYTLSTKRAGTITGNGESLTIKNKTTDTFILDTLFTAQNTYTFVLDQSSEIEINIYCRGAGHIFTNVTILVQLEKGSNATSYEPYTNGASPNPDYPQDAEVVTGNNTINICGKNLLNYENKTTNWQGASINTSDNLITYTPNSNGGGGMSHSSTTQYMRIPNGTKITFSQEYVSGNVWSSGALTNVLRLVRENGTYKDVSFGDITPNTYTTKKAITYTTTEDYVGFYTYAMMYTFSGGITPLVYQVQLEYGEATTYEAYQGASYPVNLGSIELCKIGTYQDRIYKSLVDGNWYLHKEIGKIVLDGSESWNKSGASVSSTNVFYATLSPTGVENNALSNMFIYSTATQNNTFDFANYGANIRVKVSASLYPETSDFKTWLGINHPNVYYALTEPTETQITDTTLINQLNALYNATIYSTTHINTETSNLLPYIDLKYNIVTPAPSPDRASEVKVVTGNNTITISNEDGTKTQTYNLTLGNLELCKIGNYQDYFYKENGNWYKYGAIGKVVLNGSEANWNNPDTYQGIHQYQIYNSSVLYINDNTVRVLSSYFQGTHYNNSWTRDNTVTIGGSVIRFMTSEIATLDDFKTWLSTHNTTAYYVLATPTTTQITDTNLISQLEALSQAKSRNSQTNISQSNSNLPFILDATALK